MNATEGAMYVRIIDPRDARIEELEKEVERLTNYVADRLSPVVDTVAKASNEGCLVLDCGDYSLELGYEASRAIAELQAEVARLKEEANSVIRLRTWLDTFPYLNSHVTVSNVLQALDGVKGAIL